MSGGEIWSFFTGAMGLDLGLEAVGLHPTLANEIDRRFCERRLAWSRPSPTITGRANRKGSALCHPSASRPISVHEAAALQGFPPDWIFTGAMNTQYTQVGNAVPVHLGSAIGRAVLAHEQELSKEKGKHPNVEKMIELAVARLRASARNKSAGKKTA